MLNQPNFKKIYHDIINDKFPEKKDSCAKLLNKKKLSALDVITINNILFTQSSETSQQYRSYKKSDILEILDFQKKFKLNNSEAAKHFKLSRNTVAKWRKIFLY